jgi:hypothetical protein
MAPEPQLRLPEPGSFEDLPRPIRIEVAFAETVIHECERFARGHYEVPVAELTERSVVHLRTTQDTGAGRPDRRGTQVPRTEVGHRIADCAVAATNRREAGTGSAQKRGVQEQVASVERPPQHAGDEVASLLQLRNVHSVASNWSLVRANDHL